MEGWLITWEDMDKPKRIVGFLPATMSPIDVARFVEFTYAHAAFTLGEQASYLADRTRNPYPAHIAETAPDDHRIDCGHQPLLSARLVRQVAVKEEQVDGLVETVMWEECTSSWAWDARTQTQPRIARTQGREETSG